MKVSFAMVLFLAISISFAQPSKDSSAPYFKNVSIPNFTISLVADSSNFSSSQLPQNETVLIIYFNPECDHCQKEAEIYLSKMDSLRNVKTVWIAAKYVQLKLIKEFAEKYQLQKLNAIAVGKETAYNLPLFYRMESTPYAAVYTNNKMIVEYRGHFNFEELIAINNGNFVAKPITSVISETEKAVAPKRNTKKNKHRR
jgi:thiol-disulfide isomerase/thioredoxin